MEGQLALYVITPMEPTNQPEPETASGNEPLVGQIFMDELLREIRV